jgi:hypothetical protein
LLLAVIASACLLHASAWLFGYVISEQNLSFNTRFQLLNSIKNFLFYIRVELVQQLVRGQVAGDADSSGLNSTKATSLTYPEVQSGV